MAGSDHLLAKGFLASPAGGWSGANVVFGQAVKIIAGTTLDPNQADLATAGTDLVIGLAQENLDNAKVLTGKAYFSVGIVGIAFGIAGTGGVAIGVRVAATAGGKLIAAVAGNNVVGQALAAANANDIFPVLLTPGVKI